jgi:hypothetical protein
MTRTALLSAALILAAPALAQDQAGAPSEQAVEAPAAVDPLAPEPDAAQPDTGDFDLARQREKIVECEGEKFVFAWGAGAKPTKVTLCSDKGANTQDVIRMLEDAAAKIESSPIAEDRRIALVQQIRAKITELQGKAPSSDSAAAAPALKTQPDVAALLSQPEPVAPPTAPLAPVESPPATAIAHAPVVASTPARSPLPKPNLRFECISAEFRAGGPCITLSRDTILIVKAADALQGGARLQFVRNGEIRSEQALGQLRKGQSVRFSIPRELCSGVSETEVEIRVARSGQRGDRQGQYLLRC